MKRIIIIILLLVLYIGMQAQSIKWEVDTVFSEIAFDVNHLIFSSVDGEFFGFDGLAYSDSSDFSDMKITFVVYPKSIKTDNDDRDETLKTEKFLNVDTYKTIVFSSTNMQSVDKEECKVFGNLTILGKYNTVEFDVKYLGLSRDTRQREVADFEITGVIYPERWGWNNPPFVSKKVKVKAKVRLIKIGLEY